MESKHTPTPWNWDTDSHGGVFIHCADDIQDVVMYQGGAENDQPYDGVMVDAAFIVRAVNCHGDLLSVAKRAHQVLQFSSHSPLKDSFEVVRDLAAAIAKAEGK